MTRLMKTIPVSEFLDRVAADYGDEVRDRCKTLVIGLAEVTSENGYRMVRQAMLSLTQDQPALAPLRFVSRNLEGELDMSKNQYH
jgi:hypothetical protein